MVHGSEKIDLSIIIPAIRTKEWFRLYRSVEQNCTKYNFEIIFVGPYNLPEELQQYTNVKYIRDWGSPARCMNIGASVAEGKYVTWGADDGVIINEIAPCLDILNDAEGKTVVVTKYLEAHDNIQDDSYYFLSNAYPPLPHMQNEQLIFNIAFMHLSSYLDLGGCDAIFDVSCMCLADLAVRAHNAKLPTVFYKTPTWKFDWAPGGEHIPIEKAQAKDWKTFSQVHLDTNRINIPFNNWKNSPKIWKERFHG